MINYPLASDSWGHEEIAAIHDVIASNRYTMGARVREFEEKFAEFVGAKHAVMTNSGSSANLIAIATLALHEKFRTNEKSKPNIIVPAVSWSTTFFPVHQWGFELKFVDVSIEDFNMEADAVEKAVDENTVAIFAVNLLGCPAQLEKLKHIADRYEITLLEDNCESFGASLMDGRQCGTIGHMGTFSFFFSHHLQTMEGGMVVTDDDDIVDYLRSLRAHGWIRDIIGEDLHQKTGDDFLDSYTFVLPGYCVRPLEMSGAVGVVQLQKWPANFEKRRKNAVIAQRVFDNPAFQLQTQHGKSSWFGFGILLKQNLEGKRKLVVDELKRLGVDTRPIVAGNFQRNPVIERMSCILCEAKNADYIHENGFFIGNDCVDLSEKIIKVAEVLTNLGRGK